MRRYRAGKAVLFGVCAVLAAALVGFVMMSLWNWLMPDLFGLRPIGFWQALGLLVLARLLFGRVRGGWGGPMRWRHRMRERWNQMTPEERERFREGLRGCGRPGPTEGAPTV